MRYFPGLIVVFTARAPCSMDSRRQQKPQFIIPSPVGGRLDLGLMVDSSDSASSFVCNTDRCSNRSYNLIGATSKTRILDSYRVQ